MPTSISQNAPPPPPLSAVSTLISSTSINQTTDPVFSATLQTLHNLQHQHLWTSLQIHRLTFSSSSANNNEEPKPESESKPEPSPETSPAAFVISGIPPHRIYTHPDEQLFMLERGLRDDDIDAERTFVIPTVQGQSWSLRRMAAVFDSLPKINEELGSLAAASASASAENGEEAITDDIDDDKEEKIRGYLEYRKKARETGQWGGKRLLLGMVDRGMGGEGTVVYYVVQEGAVKPRQN